MKHEHYIRIWLWHNSPSRKVVTLKFYKWPHSLQVLYLTFKHHIFYVYKRLEFNHLCIIQKIVNITRYKYLFVSNGHGILVMCVCIIAILLFNLIKHMHIMDLNLLKQLSILGLELLLFTLFHYVIHAQLTCKYF